MALWEVLLLGLIQGVAEFLPISSSGHLVIVESLLGHDGENLALNVALHFGTLLSILVVYRADILPALRRPRLIAAVVLATLPVVATGLLLNDLFNQASTSAFSAGIGLCITAALLFATPGLDRGERALPDIRLRDALVIGLFQAVAPWPGISRSGSTIVAGLMMGLRREAAANFSFYIAVPALLGATILESRKLLKGETELGIDLRYVAAATALAFVVGVIALNSLLRIVAARRLVWFAWYVLVIAIITICGALMGQL